MVRSQRRHSRLVSPTASQLYSLYLETRHPAADVDRALGELGLDRNDLWQIESVVEAAAVKALERRARRLRPRVAGPAARTVALLALLGAAALATILCLAGGLLVTRHCGAPGAPALCDNLPRPIRVALLGPSPTTSPSPVPASPSPVPPAATPTRAPTPTPIPAPTRAPMAPLTGCQIGLAGTDGGFEVLAEEELEIQPVLGDPNAFVVVWHLKPVPVANPCPDLASYAYQVRPYTDLPFGMAGLEFRLVALDGGLLEARVAFEAPQPPERGDGGSVTYAFYYLTDPAHPEDLDAYQEVPLLTLRLDWRLLPAATPTPTPTPTFTPRPTNTPRPTQKPAQMPVLPAVELMPPILKSPNPGDSVQEWVTFEWDWDGILAEDQFFDVRIRKVADPFAEARGVAAPTRERRLEVNFAGLVQDTEHWNRWLDGIRFESGDVQWSVAIVRWNGKSNSPATVLVESDLWRLVFALDGRPTLRPTSAPGGQPSGCDCAQVQCKTCDCSDQCCSQCCPKCQ